MAETTPQALPNLPSTVQDVLAGFVEAAQTAFGSDLNSVILYGSGAEGALRPTSDVNVLLVLAKFSQPSADRFREPLRFAHAAIQLKCMFLLEEEVPRAVEAFAVKFDDILHRHRVLFGRDPFAQLSIPRESKLFRLKQVLLNLTLRLRDLYVERSLREEQLSLVIADMAGPLRACAATLLELKGLSAASPKAALRKLIDSYSPSDGAQILEFLSTARDKRLLEPSVAGSVVFRMLEWSSRMHSEVEELVKKP